MEQEFKRNPLETTKLIGPLVDKHWAELRTAKERGELVGWSSGPTFIFPYAMGMKFHSMPGYSAYCAGRQAGDQVLEAAEADLVAISGQHPVITRAKNSIASFRLRAGMPIGLMVTLRGARMYDFFEKLVNVILPRTREFQGVSKNSFDGRGNYTLGFKEQIAFPEIDYDKIDKPRGLGISIVTTANGAEEGRHLLELLGLPFTKD